MKNKTKIFIGIIIGIVFLYCGIVFTDIARVKSLKKLYLLLKMVIWEV